MPGASDLIRPTALRLAEGYVSVRALGPVPVKGLDGAGGGVRAGRGEWHPAALAGDSGRGGSPALSGGHTELAALLQALEQAEAGHGQVVAVVGEAGVGKSRLVYECLHSHQHPGLAGPGERLGVLWQSDALFPRHGPAEALRPCRRCDDDPRTVRAKVTGQILALDEALQDTLPALLALLDALPADSPFRARSIRRSAVSARSTPSNGCCCVRVRCSLSWWSSKTCIGSIPRRRPCSTAWWRACPPRASSCWSTIARVSARLGQQDLLHPSTA